MHSDKNITTLSGWTVLFTLIAIDLVCVFTFIANGDSISPVLLIPTVIVFIMTFLLYPGLYTLNPNEAAVMLLFGAYKGTDKISGFKWTNPFYTKTKISLRTNSFDGSKLKVNDKKGNPIEISAVVVWHVHDTAQALFDVENYRDFVQVQSESALRHLATNYSYDNSDGETISLLASLDEVSHALENEIQNRVKAAGVVIEEARINHLAYAPEIAGAMLQRQQADAIIAARTKIVEGAVGMVQLALNRLNEDAIVQLDEERKAAMVSNLLVVLCGERGSQPIINAGSLY